MFVLPWSHPRVREHPGERGRSSCGSPGPHLLMGLFTKHAACSSLESLRISAAPLPDGLPGRSMGAETEKNLKQTSKQKNTEEHRPRSYFNLVYLYLIVASEAQQFPKIFQPRYVSKINNFFKKQTNKHINCHQKHMPKTPLKRLGRLLAGGTSLQREVTFVLPFQLGSTSTF